MWRVLYPIAVITFRFRRAWSAADYESRNRAWRKECKKRGLPDNIKNRAYLGGGEK